MKRSIFLVLLISTIVLAGCATGKNYQIDIDALNARISALQSQLGEKDQEISRLQGQLNGQISSASQLEADKRTLGDKLDQLTAELQAAKSKSTQIVTSADDSDLK